MVSLRELQLRFSASLLDPAGRYLGAELLVNGIEPARRIGIYRNAVLSNCRDALRATYSVVEQLVGAAYFSQLAAQFFRAHPSTSGDLHRYGAQFGDFLAEHDVSRQLPYLPDIARLEWALDQAFYAAESAPLDFNRLSSVPEDRQTLVTLRLHPACRLLTSRYPIHRIWEAHQEGNEPQEPIGLGEGGVHLLVRREGFEVVLETLAPAGFCLLHRLAGGAALGEAVAHALSLDPGFDPGEFLARQGRAAVFADFDWPA